MLEVIAGGKAVACRQNGWGAKELKGRMCRAMAEGPCGGECEDLSGVKSENPEGGPEGQKVKKFRKFWQP